MSLDSSYIVTKANSHQSHVTWGKFRSCGLFSWPYYILDFLTKRGNNTPPFNQPVIKFTVPTFKVNSSNTYERSKWVVFVVINNNLVVSKITSVVTVVER